jgi:hypothetical protein
MAEMGIGYGSECHLLRYLGRHRHVLDQAVCKVTGADAVDWLDYPFDQSRTWGDGEWKGLDFLPENSEAIEVWRKGMAPEGKPSELGCHQQGCGWWEGRMASGGGQGKHSGTGDFLRRK